MKGLSEKELKALRLILALTPWRRDRVSKAVGRYLDGDEHALDDAPLMRDMLDEACATLKAALDDARTEKGGDS